jgi:hypothetical protein
LSKKNGTIKRRIATPIITPIKTQKEEEESILWCEFI